MSSPNPERVLLSIMAAAARVGVCRRTIYNWCTTGKLEFVRTAGGAVRIYEDTLWRPAAKPPGSQQK